MRKGRYVCTLEGVFYDKRYLYVIGIFHVESERVYTGIGQGSRFEDKGVIDGMSRYVDG